MSPRSCSTYLALLKLASVVPVAAHTGGDLDEGAWEHQVGCQVLELAADGFQGQADAVELTGQILLDSEPAEY